MSPTGSILVREEPMMTWSSKNWRGCRSKVIYILDSKCGILWVFPMYRRPMELLGLHCWLLHTWIYRFHQVVKLPMLGEFSPWWHRWSSQCNPGIINVIQWMTLNDGEWTFISKSSDFYRFQLEVLCLPNDLTYTTIPTEGQRTPRGLLLAVLQESFMVTAKEAEEVRSLASKAKSGQDRCFSPPKIGSNWLVSDQQVSMIQWSAIINQRLW